MLKRFLAASAIATGIVGLLAGGNAFADLPWISDGNYTSGQELWVAAWKYDVCIRKNGGYNGDLIVADIYNAYYSKQIAFESFSGDSSCVSVDDVPGGYVRFVTPMGLGNMHYWSTNEDDNSDGSVDLDLSDSTTLNKYMRSYGHTMTRTEKSVATIVFDANGGEGAVPIITGAEAGSSVTLPKNTLTRVGYRFAGWNTKADGTGTSYEDEAVIPSVVAGDLQLFAQWDPMAVLDGGYYVNQKLKKLADPENADRLNINSVDSKIKTIKIADSLPDGFDTNNSDNIISNTPSWSPMPIYAWFDDADTDGDGVGDGVIYIYSDAEVINASISFGYIFHQMTAVNDVSVLAELDISMVEDVNYLFSGATSLTDISPLASWDTSHMVNMDHMFSGATSLTDISPLASWNTSSVTNMGYMFESSGGITNVDALETKRHDGKDYVSWDTSSVTNMSYMFLNARSLTDISALASWDTSSVTNMSYMFLNALSLSDISALASWDTSSVTNMSSIFSNASSLTDISALASWNTSSVTSMQGMFYQTKITNVDALETKRHDGKDYVSWDTSSVTNMSNMFLYARSLTDIAALASWDTSSVTDMGHMFQGTNSLANISALASWDTSKVTYMGYMFEASGGITNVDALETKRHDGKDYVSWDTSKVTNMGHMFAHITSLADISALASWNTSSVTVMDHMFTDAGGITNVDALETKQHDGKDYVSWDTSSVTNMEYMFWGVTSLTDISALASWNTSNVTTMSGMFYNTKITNVDALETKQHDGKDYVSWDTSSVTNMSMMFQYTTPLVDISALASWDTSRVTNMGSMFRDTAITNVDELETKRYEGKNYTSWDVSHVTDMSWMFRGTRLTDISTLASWNTSSVKNLYAMFARTGTLGDASVINGWDVSHVTDMKDMFARSSANPLPSWYHY